MTQNELFKLMEQFENSSIATLKFKDKDSNVSMSKLVATGEITPVATNLHANTQTIPEIKKEEKIAEPKKQIGNQVCTPLVGTFFTAPSPDAKPFASVGTTLKKGETMCIVEAMKMLNEIPAPYDCEVLEVLVENETLVEFNQPLFLVLEK